MLTLDVKNIYILFSIMLLKSKILWFNKENVEYIKISIKNIDVTMVHVKDSLSRSLQRIIQDSWAV